MRKRLIRLAVTLAALAALAFGASTLASAAQTGHKTSPSPSPAEVQQGDQAGPDGSADVPDNPAEASQPEQGDAPDATEASQPEQAGSESEGAADAAAQAAACTKAGIDPNAQNIQYDDQTGTCSLDAGGDSGGEN